MPSHDDISVPDLLNLIQDNADTAEILRSDITTNKEMSQHARQEIRDALSYEHAISMMHIKEIERKLEIQASICDANVSAIATLSNTINAFDKKLKAIENGAREAFQNHGTFLKHLDDGMCEMAKAVQSIYSCRNTQHNALL